MVNVAGWLKIAAHLVTSWYVPGPTRVRAPAQLRLDVSPDQVSPLRPPITRNSRCDGPRSPWQATVPWLTIVSFSRGLLPAVHVADSRLAVTWTTAAVHAAGAAIGDGGIDGETATEDGDRVGSG